MDLPAQAHDTDLGVDLPEQAHGINTGVDQEGGVPRLPTDPSTGRDAGNGVALRYHNPKISLENTVSVLTNSQTLDFP